MLLQGQRGSGDFVRTSWDTGLGVAVEHLVASTEASGSVYFLSEGVRGHLAELLELFTGEIGSGNLLYHDYTHPHSLYAANKKLFGEEQLPYYDIGNSDYLLSFGADFLGHWLSPVHHGLGFGNSRGRDGARGRFVQIEPKMSISGAAADEWVPAKPGSEGILALGVAHRIVASGAYTGADIDNWRAALSDYTGDTVAESTQVPADTIARIADQFVQAERALAIGGGAAGSHSNGSDTLLAVNALNYLIGNIGRSGGMIFNPGPASGGSASQRQAGYQSMQSLAETARQGGIDVLFINNTNPVFTMPQAAEFKEALASIPLIVSLSSFMDETTAMADVILPSHTYLESWGDDMPQPGVGFSVGAVSQPVVSPLYDTRATGDIVLELAHRLELGDSLPWANMEECVKDGWRQIYASGTQESGDFDSFWRDVLTSGVWGENVRRDQSVVIDASVIANIGIADAEFDGDNADYPFYLHPYVSTSIHDGRGANLPWMQELPEPMTSIVYGSWVEINPATATKLGIKDGDLLRVTSSQGSVEAPAVVFPAIMPDVIAMPVGQGHESFGRYANQRGVNPIQILAPTIDSTAGSLASSATRVSVVATGRRAEAVRIGGESRQLGREIVQSTGGDDAKHGAKLNSIPIVVEPV
jgi:anaerobic selenocysteine-containing dehydrogenase